MGLPPASPKRACCTRAIGCCPYCWECETPLSNFETRQDNSYRSRQDPAVTVAFELVARGRGPPGRGAVGDGPPVRALVWTTTPWTLPSNLALAVGADITYAVLQSQRGALPRRPRRASMPSADALEAGLPGARAGGHGATARSWRAVLPPAVRFLRRPGRRLSWCWPPISFPPRRGPGIVHLAPGFGEDDQRACEQAGIAVVCPVDSRARFTAEVPPYEGAAGLRGQPADNRRPQAQRRPGAPRDLRALLPALLADRHAAHIQGRQLLVRQGDGGQGHACWS